jgi:Arm DNA-binding domain/Phage integrase SAM-like domain
MVGCKIKVNRHGFLAFRLFWNKQRSWEGTGLRDTSDNRKLVEAKAVLIGRDIQAGQFDYLKWFPEGNRAEELGPKTTPPKTLGEYYRIWIERKKPPVVRPGLERDYKDHFKRYILPKFEDITFPELTPALLEAFRSYLLKERERELSLKSVRNIIDASFRAMVRDARTVDYLIEKDPLCRASMAEAKGGQAGSVRRRGQRRDPRLLSGEAPARLAFCLYAVFHWHAAV